MEAKNAIILLLSIASSIIIVAILIIFIYRILKLYNKRQFEFKEGIKVLNLEKEKEILNTRIEVQEETFQVIGREIHDNINQLLTLSKLNLNSIIPIESTIINSKIENSLQLISESIKGLTSLSRSLNTDLIKDVGITTILSEEINRLKAFNPIKIDLKFDEEIDDLLPDIQLLVFRIAQESIRNAITHGNASFIKIILLIKNSSLFFEFSDNGTGFDIQKLKANNLSQGLRNIQKRVFLANGNFEIKSGVVEGTFLKIKIPLETEINLNH